MLSQAILAAVLDWSQVSAPFAMLCPWLFGLCFLPAWSRPAVGSFDSFSTREELRHALLQWNDTDGKQLLERYGKLNAWNVSKIRNMSGLFRDLEDFNGDIGDWDTSAVEDMSLMFYGAKSFNKPIGSWNVSGVTKMMGMFGNAAMFNQNISVWETSTVKDMSFMFSGAKSFNQPIGSWNVSGVKKMI